MLVVVRKEGSCRRDGALDDERQTSQAGVAVKESGLAGADERSRKCPHKRETCRV